MKKIIWQTEGCKMYIKIANDYFDNSPSRPFVSFIIGVELKLPSWVGGELLYQAEDGFTVIGNKLLSELGHLVTSYEETKFCIKDDWADTDAYVVFDCKLNHIEVSGQLGATFCGDIVTKFKFEANANLLFNLYEVIKENTIY